MAVLILLLQIIIGAILHLLAVTLVEAGAAVVAIQAVAEEVILLAEVVAMAAEGAAEVAFVVGDKKLNSRFIGRAEYLEESRGCPLFYTKRKR